MTKYKLMQIRNASVLLLWLHGWPLEEIGELHDLGRDRLLLILMTLSIAQGRPSHMPLEEWRDARIAEALAKGVSTYVNPRGLRKQ